MNAIAAHIKKWLENSTQKQKFFAALLVFSLLATGALFSLSSTSSVAKDPLDSTPFYFLSAFVKLIAVLLLIVGSSVIVRRWMKTSPMGKMPRQMHLLETVRLSPKQALHLVSVGGQKLLIGATDQNVSLITHVEDSSVLTSVEESETQPAMDFGSVIRSFNISPENTLEKK